MAQLTWADGRETWYRVVGELTPGAGPTPVMILHGGPGASHDYCEPIANLSRSGRACVLYDQFGCGRSGHRPDAPAEFWTPQLGSVRMYRVARGTVMWRGTERRQGDQGR